MFELSIAIVAIMILPFVVSSIRGHLIKKTINKLSAKIEVLNVAPNKPYKTLKFINVSAFGHNKALLKMLKKADKINADAVIGVAHAPFGDSHNISCTAIKWE